MQVISLDVSLSHLRVFTIIREQTSSSAVAQRPRDATYVSVSGSAAERWSLTGELSLPALDLQLTDDHLCG